MRGAHRAPTSPESSALLTLILIALMTAFMVGAIGLTLWSSATTRDAVNRLPVLQPPSPTPKAWLDRLHDGLNE
jgi:flagellar basal body-associated protein FliL